MKNKNTSRIFNRDQRSKVPLLTAQWFGFIALIAVIGFSFADCSDSSGPGSGVAPTIITEALPGGTVGVAYSQTLAATGDTPISWSFDGALPEGLNLEANAIKGTPTAAGKSIFTVKATNAIESDTKKLTITIALVEMVPIPDGTFQMGSPLNETNRDSDETQHLVTLTIFSMSKSLVTQGQYEAVMGNNPSNFKAPVAPETNTANRPVEYVTWYDAVEFCNKLSTQEGLTAVYTITGRTPETGHPITGATVTANWSANGYRLPTEAEWEYACRAGTTTPFNTGNNITTNQANYNGDYPYNNNPKGENRERTTEVSSFAHNAWGLYDMHGNVFEWCWDWFSSNYYSSSPAQDPTGPVSGDSRVLRGGAWTHDGKYLRSAYRSLSYPYAWGYFIGFRIVRS
jgi:formylglycine-generating enzyme required for sulfatase activity